MFANTVKSPKKTSAASTNFTQRIFLLCFLQFHFIVFTKLHKKWRIKANNSYFFHADFASNPFRIIFVKLDIFIILADL